MKVAVAGKGGVGKTTISSLLARELARRGHRTLAVDCDPNPNLAESFGLDSNRLERFGHDGLRRAGPTLELVREPSLSSVGAKLWLLGGPPSANPLADAVARGIAGVLIAERFEFVITDLGAGPEMARIAVGGVLNPAELCFVLSDGTPPAELAADAVEAACSARAVARRRIVNRRGEPGIVARELAKCLVHLLGRPAGA